MTDVPLWPPPKGEGRFILDNGSVAKRNTPSAGVAVMLNWKSHEHIIGCLTAIGLRGEYAIQRVGPEWILNGQGHDELSMLAIPPVGRPFTSLQAAQKWATRLDNVRTIESQASGA